MKRILVQSSAFVRAAKRYVKRHPDALEAIRDALLQLEADAFDPLLHTHKLKGDLAGSWACSLAYDLRIVFDFVDQEGAEAIVLLSLGSHDEVY